MKVPLHRSFIGTSEIAEVTKALKSGWLTTGPRSKRFEEEFKKYIGCKYAIPLNSCTAGLHLALVVLGVGEGDEVITSAITFPSTANVVVHQGGVPVFADVNPETLTIEPESIRKKITEKTKAIMPVHFAGYPSDMRAIKKIAKEYNLYIVEDAAHALETEYRGKKVGAMSDFASFSFYATKNMTTCEGGMLITNNKKMAEKARIISLHGLSRDAWKRHGKGGGSGWELIYPGYKYNMFDIQAALGIHQLKRVEGFHAKREKYVGMYDAAFKDVEGIVSLKKGGAVRHAHHLYPIILKSENLNFNRDRVMAELEERGVGVGLHFPALHLQPYYRDRFGYREGMLPNAEYASDRIFSLPLYPTMRVSEVKYVIRMVREVLK